MEVNFFVLKIVVLSI